MSAWPSGVKRGIVGAIDDWVEEGTPPDRIVATSTDEDGTVRRTRPLCPYPQVATYKGTGSIDDAASFAPVYRESELGSDTLKMIDRALQHLLRTHEPNAAIVVDRLWQLRGMNRGAQRLIGWISRGTTLSPETLANPLLAIFDPDGLRPAIVNWEEIAGSLADAVTERKRRAKLVIDLDDAVEEAVKKLKEKGLTSPYLKAFVVARVNPLRFIKGDPPPMDELFPQMTKRARGMNVDNCYVEIDAREVDQAGTADEELRSLTSGGSPEEEAMLKSRLENTPVIVTVGIRQYKDKNTDEQMQVNTIKNIVRLG